jgi:hypothetical protein
MVANILAHIVVKGVVKSLEDVKWSQIDHLVL